MDLLAFVFLMFLAAASHLRIGEAQKPINVVNFGAVGNGQTDNSKAFEKAWAALCGARGREATLVIPAGTFLLKPVQFNGPCKPNTVHIQILGKLIAPGSPAAWGSCPSSWIGFNGIANLVIDGSGSLDGQGAFWWNARKSCTSPVMVFFHACNNLKLSGISLHNSPRSHLAINGCNGASISSIHIISPETSPNTDGIDISASTHMMISDSTIAAGDDCIAINGGCSNINITRISCGPGHGISIGSLGVGGAMEKVEEVHVTHCNFTKTLNGARIKTVPGGSGYARKISFEQLTVIGTTYPIVIDQHYCSGQKCKDQPKAVVVSDISFIGIHGTSTTEDAISLDCAKSGCFNIIMNDVNIRSLVAGKPAQAICNSAHGTATSVVPNVPCLTGKYFRHDN